MAGVITGKARSTDGCRLTLDDRIPMRVSHKPGMTGGYVDLSVVPHVPTRREIRKLERAATIERKREDKRKSRHRNR